jgi:hypothetical protein
MGTKMDHKFEWKLAVEHTGLEELYLDSEMVAWLQPRPSYCDRGHWQVNVDVPNLDDADGFPRYYMKKDVAISETEAFLRWRLFKEGTPAPKGLLDRMLDSTWE